ncbi:hypothetical protein [Ensifer sesbaniae]|uniref:hypothetical protein n=1 Tax=Ensifer sesbaniae TaxID=1214071 RepID=UPI003D7FC4D5
MDRTIATLISFRLPSCRQFWSKDDVHCTNPDAVIKTPLWLNNRYRTVSLQYHLPAGTYLGRARFFGMGQQTTRQRDKRSSSPHFDPRDRLILALYAELKAERETRAALEDALAHGVLSTDVLQAIISDPIPVVTGEDIAHIERALAQDRSRSAIVEDTPSIRRLRGGR